MTCPCTGYSDTELAPLLCAGIIGWLALARANLPPGGRLALYGFGASASSVGGADDAPPEPVDSAILFAPNEFLRFAAEHRLHVTTTPYPLDQADTALTDLASGRVHGAAVLIP